MLAIAWIAQVNPIFYGWDANFWSDPWTYEKQLAVYVSLEWFQHPNPVPGAFYALSEQDLSDSRIQSYLAQLPRPPGPQLDLPLPLPRKIYPCYGGLRIFIY